MKRKLQKTATTIYSAEKERKIAKREQELFANFSSIYHLKLLLFVQSCLNVSFMCVLLSLFCLLHHPSAQPTVDEKKQLARDVIEKDAENKKGK